VDFRRPVEAVIPGAQGRIVAVFAETSAELNVRTIARLSRVSVAQASRILPALVSLGIVERREAPPSALFRFVPENVAARTLTALADARRIVLRSLADRPANSILVRSAS
jgi:DNA-binding IclR family transcriptional regulator